MENRNDGIIFNPNLIWLPTPPRMESAEDFAYVDAFLPDSTGERIEDGKLQLYGIGNYTMKIGDSRRQSMMYPPISVPTVSKACCSSSVTCCFRKS